jgi:hypothetical protein
MGPLIIRGAGLKGVGFETLAAKKTSHKKD